MRAKVIVCFLGAKDSLHRPECYFCQQPMAIGNWERQEYLLHGAETLSHKWPLPMVLKVLQTSIFLNKEYLDRTFIFKKRRNLSLEVVLAWFL